MRTLLGLAMIAAMVCGSATAADEKIDGKKLVGTWEPKTPKKGESVKMEFTADGKLILMGGQGMKAEGTYVLKGDKLSFSMKIGDQTVKETVTVTKLTADELEGKGSDGKTEAFKKVKAKGKGKK